MKLSDYVASFLAKQGIKHTFGITGGAIVHIIDSIYKNSNLEHICTHHEQTAAMAADAYSRITGNFGVGITTSGPGATNLITGICCAYYDSIPTLYITGQVPTSQLKRKSKVRQIGFQETDVISIVKSITKYCSLVDNPKKIKYELEKAVYLAKTGRPGPVLLDLVDDVQRADVNPKDLESFVVPNNPIKNNNLEEKINQTLGLIKKSQRPVIIFGGGVKLGKAQEKAKEFADKLRYPIALTWATMDMFPDNYPLLIRDFGVAANRAGNFAVQNSDLILAIGTRLDTHETGNEASTFARKAKKIVVDIDKSELDKYKDRGPKVDISINCDVGDFFNYINPKVNKVKTQNISKWVDKIREWRKKYPICLPEYHNQEKVDPYVFMDALSRESSEGDIIITDAGGNLTQTMQGFKVKKGQRLFSAFNHSPMGYSLPASIGACFANDKKPVICIIGDGGIQMNIQELQTIVEHELPIKIFLMENEGYGIIRQTQDTWLNSKYVASCPKGGVSFPDFTNVARAYGLGTEIIKNHKELEDKIRKTLDYEGPILCNVELDPKSKIIPKLEFGRPIEDQSPLLDKKEFLKEMIVKPLD